MRKKILSLILTVCMVLSLLPAVSLPAAAGTSPDVAEVTIDGGTTTSYTDFTAAWNAAATATATATVTLLVNWTAAAYGTNNNTSFGTGDGFGGGNGTGTGLIRVPAGKTITLDLNGHNIDRNLTSAQDPGYVIDNKGTLTIEDGSTTTVAYQGKITGGYNSETSNSVGGIFNEGSGTLTLQGGRITGNKAINWGGGVRNVGTFTMTGGEISGNIANYDNNSDGGAGGVFTIGSFTMTGGEISGNYTCGGTFGGGVYVRYSGTMKVGGTAKITGNVSSATFNNANGIVSGGTTDNVYLLSGKTIAYSTGTSLTDGASIGVTTYSTPTDNSPVAVTGSNSTDYSEYFFSDNGDYHIENTGTGSAQVVKLVNGAAPVISVTLSGTGTTKTYADFATGWNAAVGTGNTANTTVKLLADWTATTNSTCGTSFGTGKGFGDGSENNKGFILVPQDKHITLDLNGHTIDRGLTTAQTDGEVICIASGTDTYSGGYHTVSGSAYLTVKDSSTEDTARQGKITGGRNKVSGSERFDDGSGTAAGTAAGGTAGGGIVVGDAKSMLTLEGGQITGNQSENFGGGVSVQDYGDFVMSGGTISDNTAGCGGGGVGLTGDLWLTGGSIVGNTVKGTFSGNDIKKQPVTNAGYGGGVCAYDKEPRIYMGGGTISGNVIQSSTSYGAGIYTFFETYFGGDAKVINNQKGINAVASTSDTATGGSNSNCYILPSYGSMYYLVFAYSLKNGDNTNTQYPLTAGASIGIELDSNPTPTRPVELNATPIHNSTSYSEVPDYSTYFHCDNLQYTVKKSAMSGEYTLQYAVASPSNIFGAKFYRPQVWDCQRSPAFPVADRSFRLSGLKAPYDENLKKVNFAAPASDYVTFTFVSTVEALDDTIENRIVNSLKCYTGASADSIRAAAVVKETLHSGTNQGTETELSSIGLVWALGDDGFLYTAMDGALKYSGGVGTYVTFAAHKSGDSIIYTPDKTEPYKKDEIDGKELAQKDGTPTAPNDATYQELIRVVYGSGNAVSGAMVGIRVNDAMYSGTTDAKGYVQFVDLPVQTVEEAAVQSGSYATLTYNTVDSPEAVLTYTNPSTDESGSQQGKVTATVNYGTNGSNKVGGTVSYLGAGVSTQSPYRLTKDDTAMFTIKPASGYYVSAATWGVTDILAKAKTGVYNAGAVTENTTLTVTFAEITKESIFNIKYTTAEVFDVQRSPAFPDTGDSSICFSSLDKPYDTNLNRITLGTGEYIKFDKVSSVGTAGKTDEYTGSLRWWTDATKIGTAALVKENVYDTNGYVKTLGTGLIWCYNDPAKGFMFTTMDGVLGDCGGVGSYVSFNALRYGSSVTQLTDSAEPLQWGVTDPQGQSENPGGDTVDDTQEVTFDFAGKVLNNVTPRTVVANTAVTLTWAGQNYPATTDANGRFVVSGLPYIENGDYTVTVDGKTFTDELPVPSGVENSKPRTKTLTAPEIVFLLNSTSSGTITAGATHTITVTKNEGGRVSPAGTVQVSEGGSARIGFAPSSGYCISKVEIDGTEIADAKTNGYYKFTGVTGIHTVAVTFAAGGANPGGNPGSGGSGSSGSSGSTTTTTTTGKAEPVIVDNVEHDIGTKTTTDTTTTVTVDNSKLQEQLESAKESVIVPITTKTDTTVAQLVVKNVEDMAKKDMTLSVDIGKVQYNIPSTAVQTNEVMQTLGATDPSKVPVNVTITQLKNEDVTIQNGTLQVPPVQFTVTATYGGKTVETKVFTQYVNRVIELSDGTDLSKITTAVVKEPDGAERHVPTYVYTKDGKDYAKINSLTNSTYALIYNNQSFADAAGKWYENIVSEMASREILFGRDTGVYEGDASITRAEFAAVLVRALGLPANGTSKFTDVASTDWFSGAVGTASGYGLVLGYTDGSFGPNKNITRQEAMAMMQRAAKVAEFSGKTSELTAFSDAASVSDWAISAAQYNVGSGLIVGDNGQLRPNDAITRAESATVVLRLLQKAGLVDVRSAT